MPCQNVLRNRVIRRLWNSTGVSSVSMACAVSYCAKMYSSKQFEFNQIALSNRENSSLDGVKKSVKQKLKVSKTKKDVVETTQQQTGVFIPDWFSVVLESPLYSDKQIDVSKHAQFKEFVEELDIKYMPSVSTVIKKTESKTQQEVLRKWKEAKTRELGGNEQFQRYQQATIGKGIDLHKCIELHLKGLKDLKVNPGNEGHWESVQAALGEVHNVRILEHDCVHPEMFYKGKFDCIAQLRDTLCLIEWKTSITPKPLLSATYDNPLQVAAYIGAVNRSGLVKQFNLTNLTTGALVIAYPSGEPATVHMMSQKVCERYWAKWIDRLYLYWTSQFLQEIKE